MTNKKGHKTTGMLCIDSLITPKPRCVSGEKRAVLRSTRERRECVEECIALFIKPTISRFIVVLIFLLPQQDPKHRGGNHNENDVLC